MNSVNTCMAPWTEAGEFVLRSAMRESRRSGYSSGQSQFATRDRVCA